MQHSISVLISNTQSYWPHDILSIKAVDAFICDALYSFALLKLFYPMPGGKILTFLNSGWDNPLFNRGECFRLYRQPFCVCCVLLS